MEITPLTIYLWQLADGLKEACAPIGAMLTIISIAANVIGFVGKVKPAVVGGICGLFFALLVAIIAIFTPSSKTISMMYVIPKMADSEVIKKDVPEMYEMAKEALREYVRKK